MRTNATVREAGQPLRAHYWGTRKRDGMMFMEVRYSKRQTRKWMKPGRVTLDEGVAFTGIENGREVWSG